jgi:AcrR family transcriptional regulator
MVVLHVDPRSSGSATLADVTGPSSTRERILRAAAEQFLAMGFQRTSLQGIAAQLGLTKASILYHFPTKAHLAAELVEPIVVALETAAAHAAALPPQRRAQAMIEGWLDAVLAHRDMLRMIIYDVSLLTAQVQYQRLLAVNTRAIELIGGPGAGRKDLLRAVQCIALVSDPVVYHANIDVDTAELREDILDGVRRFLGSPEPRRRDRAAAHAAATGGRARSSRGRPSALSAEQVEQARAWHRDGAHTVDEIAAHFGISRATLYRHLRF